MNWKGVVIHHSASGDVSAETIDKWHRARGFTEIGYHFVIRRDGSLEPARNFEKAGAHALTGDTKSRNSTHIGICLTGDFTKYPPSIAQLNTLINLVRGIKTRWGIEEVERHHENCPGDYFPWKLFNSAIK